MPPVAPPETRYARAGDLQLAYQKWGDGPPLLIVPPLVSHVELSWEHELNRRAFEHYGRHMTCVQFDKRGIGLSDRPEAAPTLEQRIDDITTVMDAAGWDRCSVLGMSEGALMAQLFAAEFPARVDRLVLINGIAPLRYWDRIPGLVQPDDPPLGTLEDSRAAFAELVAGWPENAEYFTKWYMPSQVNNESFVRWVARLERMSASPKTFAQQVESVLQLDGDDAPERVTRPTLVIHVTGDRVIPVVMGRIVAQLIPGARYEEIAGEDHYLWVMPSWRATADCIIEFVTGTASAPVTARRFAAVLFTDIVESTSRSAAMGDTTWHAVIDSHDRIARGLIDEHGGRVVKSTGDGLLAVFDVPSLVVACGAVLCESVRGIELTIRAGVHAGEIEVHDDGDISGIAVNLAARVEQCAADGECWVSSTVRDMMLGGAAQFADRGEHTLKGIEGTWRLFAVASSVA
jgi:class 3 adenylate cyclase